MDGGTILALFGLIAIFLLGMVSALLAVWLSKDMERGRGAAVLAAFCLPSLFAAYLFCVSYLRNEFHRSRGDAYDDGSYSTLPLGDGYKLWYFYKSPWIASIGKANLPDFANHPPLSNVQRVAVVDGWVFGGVGKTEMEDYPIDFYFSLDLDTGKLRQFASEPEMRANSPAFGSLRSPDQVFWSAQNREESRYFWPIFAGIPMALLFAGFVFLVYSRTKKPAGIPAGL